MLSQRAFRPGFVVSDSVIVDAEPFNSGLFPRSFAFDMKGDVPDLLIFQTVGPLSIDEPALVERFRFEVGVRWILSGPAVVILVSWERAP